MSTVTWLLLLITLRGPLTRDVRVLIHPKSWSDVKYNFVGAPAVRVRLWYSVNCFVGNAWHASLAVKWCTKNLRVVASFQNTLRMCCGRYLLVWTSTGLRGLDMRSFFLTDERLCSSLSGFSPAIQFSWRATRSLRGTSIHGSALDSNGACEGQEWATTIVKGATATMRYRPQLGKQVARSNTRHKKLTFTHWSRRPYHEYTQISI